MATPLSLDAPTARSLALPGQPAYKQRAMTPQPPNPAPPRRALRLVAALLLVVAVTLLALIASGAFDPRPLGSLARRDRPGPVSYTHLDVYKRQLWGHSDRPQSADWLTPAARR